MVCILTTTTITQALYNTLKVVVRQLVPAVLVILANISPCHLLGGRLSLPEERSVSCNPHNLLLDTESFQAGYPAGYFSPDHAGG